MNTFKKIALIMIISFLFLTSCSKNNVSDDESLGSLSDVTSCEVLRQDPSIDLNLNNCFYKEGDLIDAQELTITVPDASNPYKTKKISTYALSKNFNIKYALKIIASLVAPLEKDLEFFVNQDNTSEVTVSIPNYVSDLFYATYSLESLGVNKNAYEINQILATCIANTIYDNFSEVNNVAFLMSMPGGVDYYLSDNVFVEKSTGLPTFFGGKNNIVGDFTYDYFLENIPDDIKSLVDEIDLVNVHIHNYIMAYAEANQ